MSKSRMQIMRNDRLSKLKKLKELKINVYPSRSHRTHTVKQVLNNLGQLSEQKITLAGRILAIRHHGQLAFIDLQDASGSIQLYIKVDELSKLDPEEQNLGFEQLDLLDTGDFIEASGTMTETKSGEISLLPSEMRILTKALRPLPFGQDLPQDPEYLFRRRYVDLAIHPQRRQLFRRKAAFWKAHRDFLDKRGFIEVEMPVLEHATGGADAAPFETHMNALDEDFYLRISTELYQKRLIGGGFEKVYTLGPNFRNEGIDDEHLPEYYQCEWYWAYADYRDNMDLVKDLFRYVAKEVYGSTKFTTRGHTFDLADDWDRISYPDIIKDRFGVDIFDTSNKEMLEIIHENGVELDGAINRNRLIDNLWKLIRKDVSGPAFLINEPAFMSPLAKSRSDNPRLTERYHVIIAGSENGNGYSELNNPLVQLERFKSQQQQRDKGDDEAHMLDIDFVEMLEFGMPPTSGHGHSERLFWFLEDISAKEGTIFPTLRQKVSKTTKEIYNFSTETKTREKDNMSLPARQESEALLKKYIDNINLRKHCRMVAEAVAAYARKLGEDEELWYHAGLLHDLDWEKYPDEHPMKAVNDLLDDYPSQLVNAVKAHAPHITGKQPQTKLEKYLFACDELSGFMTAYALMRPTHFEGMKPSKVKKKLKDTSFAASVSRDDIKQGFDMIEQDPNEHIQFLVDVFKNLNWIFN